ncbi:flagellar hook assembly protein FlgD [Sphingomonas sp. RIT328]|uniref:flagellar hook assembly protein FlgD n=1 Tax=Sphingomonas sp. RIT328 TaxID=1470591 RepID=UPI0004491C9E|nr:flagellar hook capping FlgD N-terminal domain-containing protein [Sphingomonas sp. RIT328]EZP48668.1 Flagellar hook capping protein [Sphingomonas sp. RIT328]
MTQIATTATTASQVPSAAQKTLAPDLNMFLKMLTTQLQHQDPLSPMDTAQYTQQLVQYSQVEQALQQNSTLKSILGNLTAQSMAQASNLVGREIVMDSNVAGLAGTAPAVWNYSLGQVPATLTATITDASGHIVNQTTLTPSALGDVTWDGSTANGHAKDGAYTLTLKAQTADGNDLPVTISTKGIVGEVVQNSGTVLLGINGIHLPLAKMISVAAAS